MHGLELKQQQGFQNMRHADIRTNPQGGGYGGQGGYGGGGY